MINQPQQQDQIAKLAELIASANTQNAQPQMMAQQPQSAYVQPPQQPQQQQQGMSGMNPSNFMPDSAAPAATTYGGAEASGIGFGGTGTGATAGPMVGEALPVWEFGGTAGSGGSSAASSASAAGPWAALAAAIMVNEYNAKGGGYRNEDDKKYAWDLLSGNVAQQDMEQRWGPKMGDNAFGGDMIGSSQLMQGKLSEGWDTLKNKGMLGEILDIF